ncbi:glycosyltransferase family 4 protein [Halorussus limi]|uniref:Glycosyltransferase family 4 protein n=1 Tax=Halorussus limi TaxID=2938695 RepID=A0A8U0HWN6_9EURY|nr:glycosyltransferase family 1 protein [Halorussus limi]UPV75249.1 glycosyltransferase family 4 protein [Halorussus limi]
MSEKELRRMRVGIQTERLHQSVGGPQVYRRKLCEALLDLTDDVKFVFFQFSDDSLPLFDHPRVEPVVIPSIPGLAARRLAEFDLDVIHFEEGIHRFPLVGRLSASTVTTIHGIEPLVIDEHPAPLKTRIQKTHVWPYLCRKLDHVIAVSESSRRQLLDHYPLDEGAVSAVYNGIDHDRFTPLSDEVIERGLDGLDVEQPYFLTVNNCSQRKNPTGLVQSFDEAARRRSDISLIVAGSGWDTPEIDRLIVNADFGNRITRLGKVPESILPSLYAGATAMISPTYHENFGLTLAEAMACGTPVIASNVYAVPEVVGDGGVLIDNPDDATAFADTMVRLLDNPNRHKRLANRGIEQTAQFTWEECARRTFNIYERLYRNV